MKKRHRTFGRIFVCSIVGMVLATGMGVLAGEDQGEEPARVRERAGETRRMEAEEAAEPILRDQVQERRRQAIERLQSGETDRMLTLGQLLLSEEVDVDVIEISCGVELVVTSEDEGMAAHIREVIKAALERRERVRFRRREAERVQEERTERQQQRFGDMDEEERERRLQELREQREALQAMSPEERQEFIEEQREERRRRMEERLEQMTPEERERFEERMERMRERRQRGDRDRRDRE